MRKSIHRSENKALLELIKQFRVQAGLTQAEVSAKLSKSQSFISDVERGSRRLDLIQLRDLCGVLGTDLMTLISEFERTLILKRKRSTHQ